MTDSPAENFKEKRIHHWDRISKSKENPERLGAFYQKLLHHYYRFLVPAGSSVLEIGCGHGDLLAAVGPAFGVGIDFSREMIEQARRNHPQHLFIQADAHDFALDRKFDVILLSDLINDAWDVQEIFKNLHHVCHSGTRIIINFYNNLWRIPLSVIKKMGKGADLLDQNWFAPYDVYNLLNLAGFEVINLRSQILLPVRIPYLSSFCNRYMVKLPIFKWFALANFVVARPVSPAEPTDFKRGPSVSVIVAARNEAGNIENIFSSVPSMGGETELVFVEGHSSDNTYETIEKVKTRYPDIKCQLMRQTGKGKGDAVRLGFEKANGDILMILDADLTVPPKDLPRFYEAISSNKGDFINGVRLVYPMEDRAMRFLNILGNKFFSLAFTWLLEQPIKDTLCGTKVLWKSDYLKIAGNRDYFGDFDPFGDFDLLFGASRLNLKIVEVPIRYRERTYGDTNISRWRHGWLLLRMVLFAARRIKFI